MTLVVKAQRAAAMYSWIVKAVAIVCCGFLLSACGKNPSELQLHAFDGATMGTSYSVKLVAKTLVAKRRQQLQTDIDVRLAQLDQIFSTYRPDSELSRFNQTPVDQWQALSESLLFLLQQSLQIHHLSQGAFDISLGPLVDLWGFGGQSEARLHDLVPAQAQVQRILDQRVGMKKMQLDLKQQRAKKQAVVELDLSAIAKGYAVDQLAALLTARGYKHFLVEIGGELLAKGHKPGGENWRVAIEAPVLHQRQVQQVLVLQDMAVATSGDYRNYFEIQGQRYSHMIDPESGAPITHRLASVTVLHPVCATADAWATALMVAGPSKARQLAKQHDLAVMLLIKNKNGDNSFSRVMSPRFQRLWGSS